MQYDLKDLITFTTVATLRSFAGASERLKISKSVVSTRIADLEKSLKLTLLSRTTREVDLTNDGRAFFDYCVSIIKKVEDLDRFLEHGRGVNGVLKLVLPAYFSRYHIVPYLGEFLTKYPDLRLDISLTENPINITYEGYDLQVRIQIPEEEDLEVAELMTNHKIVCASTKYIEKFGEPKKPQDLLKHNCLIFGENNIWSFKHKTSKEIIKLGDLKGNIKCDNGEIIKELVLSGLGITLKSSRDAFEEIKSKKIVVLLPDYEIVNKTQFYAVYPKAKYMSPKVKAFIEFFQKKLEKA